MKVSKILTAAAAVASLLGASSAIAATSAHPVAAKLSVASAQALRIGGIQKRAKNNLSNIAAGVSGVVALTGIIAVAVETDPASP